MKWSRGIRAETNGDRDLMMKEISSHMASVVTKCLEPTSSAIFE